MIEVTIEMKSKAHLTYQCLKIQTRELLRWTCRLLESPTNMPHTLTECVGMDAIFICLTFACSNNFSISSKHGASLSWEWSGTPPLLAGSFARAIWSHLVNLSANVLQR